jgi:hypothetical protein
MRTAGLAIESLLLLAISLLALGAAFSPRLDAQVAAPGPAPLTAPAAPGQPQPFATIGALPALVPAPGSQVAGVPSALATPRVFKCSCSGPGFPTSWVGNVPASSYFSARQAATGQCVNYKVNANAPSPYIRPSQGQGEAIAQGPTIYNGTAFNSHEQAASSAIVTAPVAMAKGQVTAQCSQCACN